MRFVALVALASGILPLCAQETTFTRQGPFWVQTTTGSDVAVTRGRLRVSTQGPVTVRGGAENQVQYTVTRRVKARSESDARRLLREVAAKSYRQGDMNGITIALGGERQGDAELNVTVPRSFRESIVETHGGGIDAADLSGGLEAETGGGPIRLDRISGPVRAMTAGGQIDLGAMGSSVRCRTAGGAIRAQKIAGDAVLETAGGDISVDEVGGTLRASTAGGGIHIIQAGSTVAVNTAGGAIEVGSARGMVTAGSSSGPIRIGAANGVQCDTGGGLVRLANVTGAVNVSTAAGNVIAQLLSGGAPRDSFLVTGLGDITVFVPSNLGIRILAQIESNGRIVSDFPAVKTRGGARQALAEGDINGGGPLLRLSSAGGTIYIRREK